MNELVRHFCVVFLEYKKIAIFHNFLFFTGIFCSEEAFCVKTLSKKID